MSLVKEINKLKKSKIKKQIDSRIKEFHSLKNKSNNSLFNEMCFCLLTANYNATGALKIEKEIGNGFCTLTKSKLTKQLVKLGHRYPNKRSEYIIEARKNKDSLKKVLKLEDPRQWLLDNVKGLGMKESSHFLRNVGFTDYAIIDFHVVDILVDNKLIERPKTLTRKKYLEIEEVLRKLGKKVKLNLAQLDVYLWYLETGKIQK